VPITGRSTLVGLVDLVGQLADGEASAFGGQGPPPAELPLDHQPETFAMFTWTPASGGAGTPVMVNVQPGFDRIGPVVSGKPFFSCRDDRVRCSVERTADLVVVSYEEHAQGAVDRHVDVLHRSTGYRVSLASTNASAFEKGDQVRPEPPLTTEVLRTIATSDVWGDTLPLTWDQAGEGLSPYRDYDAEQP
jgi:hypothetical protein